MRPLTPTADMDSENQIVAVDQSTYLCPMISIFYSEGDYGAADIAVKLQALAQLQAGQIFIVPKHFGRNQINVEKNLKKSKTAIFLAHDKNVLDSHTKREVAFLSRNKARIYAIVPVQFKQSLQLPKSVSTNYYDKLKGGDFLKTVQKISTEFQSRRQPANSDFSALLVIMALIIFIVAAFDNGKK